MMGSPEKLPLLDEIGILEMKDQEAKSSLLQHHLSLFNDLIKVQPQRHTEQQLKMERVKKNSDLLEGKQSELDRIRLEYQVQNTGNKSRKGVNLSDTDFESQRKEMIKRQREMERKRNEEESVLILDHGKEERRNKTSKVKWYEKEYGRKINEVHTRNDQVWNQYKQRTTDNIWNKRKEQHFRHKEELQELLPKNESDEELMFRKAIELSKLAAKETAVMPRNVTKQIQSIWDIDYGNAAPTSYNDGYANALKKPGTFNKNKHQYQSSSQVTFQSSIKQSINTGQDTRSVGHEDMKDLGNDGCYTAKRKISEESFLKRAEPSRTLSKGTINTSKANTFSVSGKRFIHGSLSGSQESNMAEQNYKKIKTDFGQTGDISVRTEDWNAECDYWNVYTRPGNDQQYTNTETCSSDGSDLWSDTSETDENDMSDTVKQSKFGKVKDKQSGDSKESLDILPFTEDSVGDKKKRDSDKCGKINKYYSSYLDMDNEMLYSHRQMSPVGIKDSIITSDISSRNTKTGSMSSSELQFVPVSDSADDQQTYAMTDLARKALVNKDNKAALKTEGSVTGTKSVTKSVKFADIEIPSKSAVVDTDSKYKQTVHDKINISSQENKRVLKIPRLPVATSNSANCSVKQSNPLQNSVPKSENIAVDALTSVKLDLQNSQVSIQTRQDKLETSHKLSTCKEKPLKDVHVYKIDCGAKFETEAKNHGKANKGITPSMQLHESASGQSSDTYEKFQEQMKLKTVQQPILSVGSGRIFPVSQHNDLYQDIPITFQDDRNQEVYTEPCQITQASSEHSNPSPIDNIPQGLPAHLYQAYYQYLQQANDNNSQTKYFKDKQELAGLSQSKEAHPGQSGPFQITQASSEKSNPPQIGNIPQGLPAHLHQAYFQYLQQPQKNDLNQNNSNNTKELVQQNTISDVDQDCNQNMPFIDQCIPPFISSSISSKYATNILMVQAQEMMKQCHIRNNGTMPQEMIDIDPSQFNEPNSYSTDVCSSSCNNLRNISKDKGVVNTNHVPRDQSINWQGQEGVEEMESSQEDCTALVIGLKGKLGMSSESELRIPRLPAVASLLTRKNLKALNIDPSLYVKRKIESVKSSRQQKSKALNSEKNSSPREIFHRKPGNKENRYWCGSTRNLPSVPELGQTDEECGWVETGNLSSTIDNLALKTVHHNSSHELNTGRKSDTDDSGSPKIPGAAEVHAKNSYFQICSKQNQIFQKLVMKEYGEMTKPGDSSSVITETGEGCHVKSSTDKSQLAAEQNQMIRDMITGMRQKEQFKNQPMESGDTTNLRQF